MLKQLIKLAFHYLGYRIVPLSSQNNRSFLMFEALQRCNERNLVINTVVDIGASDGRWTKECLKQFPKANYLLIEAQQAHENALQKHFKTNKTLSV